MKILKAIILAAGQGRRLIPMTECVPKCCLLLDGKSMLEWQIEALAASEVEEIVVVTGFGHRAVDDVVNRTRNIPVRTLYNPFYSISDNLGTCWVARNEMTESFLLINGDTMFEFALLERLLSNENTYPITLATDQKSQYDEDDMKISTDQEQLLRVGKRLKPENVTGESIGMIVFNQCGADAFVHQVERVISGPEGLTRWYLSAIDDLAQAGQVGVCSINGHNWCEVDDLDDFAFAHNAIGAWQRKPPVPSRHAGKENRVDSVPSGVAISS